MSREQKLAGGNTPAERQTIEMLDGRVYWSTDGWQTVWQRRVTGLHRRVTGKEADLVRLLAAHQAGDPRFGDVS